VLLSVTPNLAVVGETLTVFGTNFLPDPTLMHVFLEGQLVPAVAATALSVSFILPDLSGRRGVLKVSVVVVGQGRAIGELVVTSQVRLIATTPDSGSQGGGTILSLTGTGFSTLPGTTRVFLSSSADPVSVAAWGVECDLGSPPSASATTFNCITRELLRGVYYVIVDVAPVTSMDIVDSVQSGLLFEGFVCASPARCAFDATPRRTPVISSLSSASGEYGGVLGIFGTGYVLLRAFP
jgi:hypothetical protein